MVTGERQSKDTHHTIVVTGDYPAVLQDTKR